MASGTAFMEGVQVTEPNPTWLLRTQGIVVFPAFALAFPGRVHGRERVPRTGPVIFACNHSSFGDPWFFLLRSPRFPVHFLITTKWYTRSRAWHGFFRANGTIPTDPDQPALTMTRVLKALERGRAVAIFPEGTITATGLINRGRYGIGWMAALSGVPVVPCALRGAYAALPRSRRMPRPHRIDLHVGEPIRFGAEPVDAPEPGDVHAFVGRLMTSICELAGQPERIEAAQPILRDNALRFTRAGDRVVALK